MTFKCPVCQDDGISLKGKIFARKRRPAKCCFCNAEVIPDPQISQVIYVLGLIVMYVAVYWSFKLTSWLPLIFEFLCYEIALYFVPLVNKDNGKNLSGRQ